MRMEGKNRVRDEELDDGKKPQELDLSGMSLDSLPNPSINLGAIIKLDLSNNNLQCIPESLTARLLNLVVLDVHSNQLRALPNSIGCLSKLKALNLTDLRKLAVNSNKLAFLPYSTSHMTSLRFLDARLNCLRSLPDGLENLIRLEVLNVGHNFHYLQSLPYAIGLLVSLVELDISYNSIGALPSSMGCMAKLRKFRAEGNPLVCPPMDVVEQGVESVREYLSARMNGSDTARASPAKKNSWIKKLVKCGTFSGGMLSSSISVGDENDGLLLSDYRSIDGLASPRDVGIFSPRRLFSPRRASPRK
ncbi:hypothetical protein BHM03_00016846 [Ensete ventricosum]|uniref:Uncharacterized protein n=1 Tax=Ensete ventricosum TaxID=4639 RepID=A0A445MER7_ENSVE|nr:hypothetical protein BHM03_00016846 [Ensete ventricosum]